MKTLQLALCIVLLVPIGAGCTPGSDEPQTTMCSSDRDLIAFIDAEWEQQRQDKHRRTTAPDKDCIVWSGDQPPLRDWINERTKNFYASCAPPVGAVTGTAEDNANLKKALEESNIAFSTKMQRESEWIFWDERDNEKARAVVKRVWGTDITLPTADDQAALAEARRSWAVDEKRASAIVLEAYPNILSNAYIAPSVATFRSQSLPGFEDAGRYAWIVLIVCNSGRMHARFFVHPINGALVPSVRPGDKDSAQCM
jgi:hypothetical protein